MIFVEVKALAGVNYVRATEVIAVRYEDREKCTVVFSGGITMSCVEAASAVAARVAAAIEGKPVEAPVAEETEHADAG